MNKREQLLKENLHSRAEEAFPPMSNVWPMIQARFAEQPTIPDEREVSMQPTSKQHHTRLLASLALAAIVLAGVILIAPQGRAWAQDVIRFFTRASADEYPRQTIQMTSQPEAIQPEAEAATSNPFPLDLAQAKTAAGFAVREPAGLPEGWAFIGAEYNPDLQSVTLYYGGAIPEDPEVRPRFWIRQNPVGVDAFCPGSADICEKVGASAQAVPVEINGLPGEYLEGVWQWTDAGPVWQNDPLAKNLRWEQDGVALWLFAGPDQYFTQEDLVRLAESVR